ncbi:MAG: AhpC/TSA family protein [Ardenticatenales bacterium]|nr:AhpC/TSA family protein [Ardenticatenales bacterium]
MRARLGPGDPAPDVTVLDAEGGLVRLADRWPDGPTALLFIRHFGCPYCQIALRELAAERPALEALGARVVAVAIGEPEHAVRFGRKAAPGVDVLVSPDTSAHRAFGMRRALPWEFVHPRAVARGVRLAAQGILPRVPTGDPFLLPGTFVIDRAGRVRYARYAADVSDNPDWGALRAAVAAARGAASAID